MARPVRSSTTRVTRQPCTTLINVWFESVGGATSPHPTHVFALIVGGGRSETAGIHISTAVPAARYSSARRIFQRVTDPAGRVPSQRAGKAYIPGRSVRRETVDAPGAADLGQP